MRNESEQHDKPGSHNQRIGRELYNQERDQHPNKRYGYRGEQDRKWDEGNFFHTGPSPRGAQDRNRPDNTTRGEQRSSYLQQPDASREQHYGSRPSSTYRNEDRYLDHGQSGERHYSSRTPVSRGSQPGNYNEPPTSQDSLWREGPGTRSRYKEDDYRYGSGSHNWYSEGRYSPDVEPEEGRDKRGFFERVRNTWDDIMNSDDPEYRPHNRYDADRRAEQLSSRQRYSGEAYRDRSFDSGYEGGPRWADETDSGNDSYYKDRSRDQRKNR